MGYPKEVYDKAWGELSRRRHGSRKLTQQRREQVYAQIPEIREIEHRMADTAASVARVVVVSPDQAEQRVRELREENLALQARRQELLEQHGWEPDCLADHHYCQMCRDTGYIGNQMCSCMRELLKKEAYTRLGEISGAKHCSFANFDLRYYPEEPDATGIRPRARMGEILEACRQYAHHFSRASGSLLMLGHTGLGKTHLSLSIASQVTDAGCGVVYTPVQRLMDKLEADKFSRGSESGQYADDIRYVLECDLLVLDDLGTEFYTQFSGSVLYNIINSRLVEERPTIISTNLELAKIEERYSQRMVSRLVCGCKVLKFVGKDIRFLKKSAESAGDIRG